MRGKTASAARILSPKQTGRPLPCLLIQSFFYEGHFFSTKMLLNAFVMSTSPSTQNAKMNFTRISSGRTVSIGDIKYQIINYFKLKLLRHFLSMFFPMNFLHLRRMCTGALVSLRQLLSHRRRIKAEYKAKVVAAVWGTEYCRINIIAALDIFHQV